MPPEELFNLPQPKDKWTAETALEDQSDWQRHKIRLKYGCGAETGFSLTCERDMIHNYVMHMCEQITYIL